MPMRSDRIKRGPARRPRSELDWFAEDPWAERDSSAREDEQDEWNDGLTESVGHNVATDDDEWGDDECEGWGPIRLRRGHLRDAH